MLYVVHFLLMTSVVTDGLETGRRDLAKHNNTHLRREQTAAVVSHASPPGAARRRGFQGQARRRGDRGPFAVRQDIKKPL